MLSLWAVSINGSETALSIRGTELGDGLVRPLEASSNSFLARPRERASSGILPGPQTKMAITIIPMTTHSYPTIAITISYLRAWPFQALTFYQDWLWYRLFGRLSDLYLGFLLLSFIVLAVKSVWQFYVPVGDVLRLLEVFRRMVNDSIRIGLLNDASSLRRLSLLSYNQLAQYDSPSYYKLCAISRAAGILAARNKSVRRGYPTRTPYAVRQQLSCYGFKIESGYLLIPVSRGKRFRIPLTKHTSEVISQQGAKVRSFTLTRNRLSLCIARDPPIIECVSTVGVDRNLRNLTVGNDQETHHYDLSRSVRIANTTVRIIASFTRDDARTRTTIASKYGQRRTTRTSHLLH